MDRKFWCIWHHYDSVFVLYGDKVDDSKFFPHNLPFISQWESNCMFIGRDRNILISGYL